MILKLQITWSVNLFSEWRQVSFAYDDDPYGSDVGYSVDELKRIEYREKLEALSNSVSNFNHIGFAHSILQNTMR